MQREGGSTNSPSTYLCSNVAVAAATISTRSEDSIKLKVKKREYSLFGEPGEPSANFLYQPPPLPSF